MKKLLILITVIVCLGFFLAFAGVPMTGFLKGAGILAAILVVGTIIGAIILLGGFYAVIILCVALPMAGGFFLVWLVEAIFGHRSEIFCEFLGLIGFVLTIYLCSHPLRWLYSLVEILG